MKHITPGENEIYFNILRDLPYFQASTNYYGIKVKSHDTQAEKLVLVRDVSASPSSYQRFYLTGSTTSDDLSNAVIKMLPYGMWYATVYPSSGSSVSDVDTSTALWNGIIYSKES